MPKVARAAVLSRLGYGGTRNPPCIPKGHGTETLHLPLRAPHFYPTNAYSREYLFDVEGNRYIDFSAGLVVPCGHCHPPVVRAVVEASSQLEGCEDYTSPYRAELTERLAEIYPDLGGVQFYSSGTEAVEAGLRLMRAISGRNEFLAFHGSYHGKSLGSVSLATMQTYNGPRATGFYRAPYANCYRCAYDKRYPECELYCADRLPHIVHQLCNDKLAGIVIEPVQGFGGAVVPPPAYLGLEAGQVLNRA